MGRGWLVESVEVVLNCGFTGLRGVQGMQAGRQWAGWEGKAVIERWDLMSGSQKLRTNPLY